jgi:crotonobetainyl-CoA:carnitine CoA-transferase CaiB-like acyl-CoA transferase
VTGRGKAIEVAMFDTMADMMSVPLLHNDYAGKTTPRGGLAHASIFPYGGVPCRDGQIVIVVQNAGEWRRLCTDVLRRPDLVDDPRFLDNPKRVENRATLGPIIEGVFGAMTRAEAIARLEAASLAWSNVSTVADLSSHPALRRMSVDTPAGAFEGVASPVRRDVKGGAVPALGEHTERIRREFAEKRP